MTNAECDDPGASGRPVALGRLLNQVVRRYGVAEKSGLNELNSLWARISGRQVSAKSRVRRLRNGVLEIGVCNGAVLEELSSYRRQDLLKEIQSRHPEAGIRSIRFVRDR